MKVLRMPALVLALALQIAPVARFGSAHQALPASSFAVVFKCVLGMAAVLGGYDAVSAASAAIVGLSSNTGDAAVTTRATGTVGQPFSYRIYVRDTQKDHDQDYWNAQPLPPGLTINTNVGGNGWITGTPTQPGSYVVKLTAGNMNYDIPITKNVIVVIGGTGSSPPAIVSQPADQIVVAGSNPSFTVSASGLDLKYEWMWNNNPIPNSNTGTLTLPNVTPSQSGNYSVAVSNGSGKAVSSEAQLLVVPPPNAAVAPGFAPLFLQNRQIVLSFATAPGYRYILESSDSLKVDRWTELTNVPPSFNASKSELIQNVTNPGRRFYRIRLPAN